jgi:hypothetical protein
MQNALHVSDGLSVYHQELKTAHTATVYVKQLLLPAAIGDEMERSFISLYVFFWVIPRRLNFIFRRFGTLCSIFLGMEVNND